jgi:hypothetical protein
MTQPMATIKKPSQGRSANEYTDDPTDPQWYELKVMEEHGYRNAQPHTYPFDQQKQSQELKYKPVVEHKVPLVKVLWYL